MLFIYDFIKKNKISYFKLYELLDISKTYFQSKLYGKCDFTIAELEKLKEYFISLGLIDKSFDIGHFVDFV